MYLARIREGQKYKYVIRKSYFDSDRDCYYFKQVFDLGYNPARYIEQYSENVFCFEDSLQSAVALDYDGDPTSVLEELLWSFLPEDEKQRILRFRRTGNIKLSPLTDKEKEEVDHHIHLFDRRRLYYIRYGAVDQGRIFRLADKIYRPLLFKCRDEKEYYFKEQEKVLRPEEFKTYVYVIFNLQQNFSEIYASFMPEALEPEKVEDLLERELCRLNGDISFWSGEKPKFFLHEHLQRYIVRFFDLDYERQSFGSQFFRNFSDSHRKFRWPDRKSAVSEDEISSIFGKKIEVLKTMQKSDLARLFRKKAKEFHPDHGGDQKKFINLLTAYEDLKSHKSD